MAAQERAWTCGLWCSRAEKLGQGCSTRCSLRGVQATLQAGAELPGSLLNFLRLRCRCKRIYKRHSNSINVEKQVRPAFWQSCQPAASLAGKVVQTCHQLVF